MTTFYVDEQTAKGFREAVENKYPGRYGEIKRQVKEAIKRRTEELLKNE